MGKLCAQIGSTPPANCCVPPCSLIFRTKTSTATLCGISEHVSPSSPPKKYRSQAIGGDKIICNVCSGHPSGVAVEKWSGTYNYSASDCSTSPGSSSISERRLLNFNCDGFVGDWALNGSIGPILSISPSGDGGVTVVTTQLRIESTNNGCMAGSKYVTASFAAGPGLYAQLSNEDTEDDAINRADALIGSWTSCPSNCTGYKEIRAAADFTLAYRHLQLAVVTPGSASGITYEATITIRRRAYGTSDPFVEWIELTHQYVGTGGTYTGPWLHVPVESGYEVEASACANAIDT